MINEEINTLTYIVIIYSMIIIIWDIYRWKSSSKIYEIFKKRDLDEISKKEYMEKIVKDYESRESSFRVKGREPPGL